MKRLTDSCKLAGALEHPCRQGRRTVTSLIAGTVGNEHQRNHELANPQYKDLADGVGASNLRDGHSRSNDLTNKSANLAEADGMKSRWNEKHLVYGPNAGVPNPMLQRVVSPGEPGATISCHKAEAESPRGVTPSPKPAIPSENRKLRPDEYNVQKARIHANLWQQEIKKHLGESSCIEADADSGLRESSGWDPGNSLSEDWESLDPSEGHYHGENLVKEEAMMLEEFQKRRERNRIQKVFFFPFSRLPAL